MAFVLARKHARALRRYALALLALVPVVAIVLILIWPSTHIWLAPLAAVACVSGLFVERWLFFAQARHAVAAYFPARRG
jgi:DMSO reductase anchor subunit